MHEGHQLAMGLRKAYLSFHRQANAWTLNHGVTADQFVLLSVVDREPGITQISIVDRTASDANTVAAILKLLEERGLVRREAHARDRRARCTFLTVQGRRVLRRTAKEIEPLQAALLDCVPDCERIQIERFLQRVHEVFTIPLAGTNGQTPRRSPSAKRRYIA